NILVQQPSPDVLVVTMTGVAVAGPCPCKVSAASVTFDLLQEFKVTPVKPDVGKVTLTLEARVIGLLRSHKCGGGSASMAPAMATVTPCDSGPELAHVELQGHSVACGENLSVNDQVGPVCAPICCGKYALKQQFAIEAAYPCSLLLCKSASA